MIQGVFTALISPMTAQGSIDWDAYKRLLDDQEKNGISGVIPCGTTGESPTLTFEEKKKLIETAVTHLKNSKTKVFAGTGSNNTLETIENSQWADRAGVAGVLVVTPYYNKPSQAGLKQHFQMVADAVKCEVMPYNVPGRTSVSLTAETVRDLAQHPRINSIKEATGNVAFTSDIIRALGPLQNKLGIFSGDDATYLPLLCVGAAGCVSVASNFIPKEMVEMDQAFRAGNISRAMQIHQKYYPIFKDLFVDTNPVPIKFAMSLRGFGTLNVRPPLAALSPNHQSLLKQVFKDCGVTHG